MNRFFKLIKTCLVCLCLLLLFASCSSPSSSSDAYDDNTGTEMTLLFTFGERTGKYTGDLNADGLPNGQGFFIAKNESGETWTYEGQFINGHFEGQGKTSWEGGRTEEGIYHNDVLEPLRGDDLKSLYTEPEKFKDKKVEITGQLLSAPDYQDNTTVFQLLGDPENFKKNTIVRIAQDIELDSDAYVIVVGYVGDVFTGQNMFGAEISAPIIEAISIEVISEQEVLSPTKVTKDVNQTQTQFGYSVTVVKVELADNETRVYLKVVNEGSDNFSLYSFNAKIIQDSKQYEETYNFNSDVEELQTDLMPGVTTEGVFTFGAIQDAPFTLYLDGGSDNWDEDIEPFKFTIQ